MDSAIELAFAGQAFLADTRRALFWPKTSTLILADLHLGKAVDYSPRGTLLPPYEFTDIRERLTALIEDYKPRRLLALGDSFHRRHSAERMQHEEKSILSELLQRVEEWVFVEGNHDAGGFDIMLCESVGHVMEEEIIFLHQAKKNEKIPAIFGHYHPKFIQTHRQAGRISKPCFIWNESFLILPAFGTYTGGMDIRQPVIQNFFKGTYNVATADTFPKPAIFHLNAAENNSKA